MINYSWCGIGQTGHGRVYKCIAILFGANEGVVYGSGIKFHFGGGGGGGVREMTL